jgi:ATP/maltotriose-dependent transcriptional regulator MalT
LQAAARTFAEAARVGAAFGDADLVNLARQGEGRALVSLGRTADGVALLDEVMIAVTSGELSPVIAGVVYCSVISACFEMLDIRRAQEWTDALNRWCASQPDMVPFRGQCLVHRAEILLLHGLWSDAMTEARRACERLRQPEPQRVAGAAFYHIAELHRLRGEFSDAEQAYRRAAELGRTPQPGMALLRLAQGQIDAARAAILRARETAGDRRTRSGVLAAAAEIELRSGNTNPARAAGDELAALAIELDTPFLRALTLHTSGAILLAQGDAHESLRPLRDARTLWRELNVPYEAARATALIANASHVLGDIDGAEMELHAAKRIFEQLGARPALRALEAPDQQIGAEPLTPREVEVLKLVACGKTNRAIAGELAISEKTVARHVSNIFVKLDVSSRSAATAYAFSHRLV